MGGRIVFGDFLKFSTTHTHTQKMKLRFKHSRKDMACVCLKGVRKNNEIIRKREKYEGEEEVGVSEIEKFEYFL